MNLQLDTTQFAVRIVDSDGLLQAVFDEASRPSPRWLRSQIKRGTIPHLKIGRLVRFDIDAVRRALAENCTVQAKTVKRNAA